MNRREIMGRASVAAASLPLIRPRLILASELPPDLTEMGASVLSAAIKQRHVSCKEVMQSYNSVFGATGSNANTAIIFGPNEEQEQL